MTVEVLPLGWVVGVDSREGHWLHLTLGGVLVGAVTLRPLDAPGVILLDRLEVWEPLGTGVRRARRVLWRHLEVPVPPSLRRRGLGTTLLGAALGLARQEGHHRVRVVLSAELLAARPWLIEWFAARGFRMDPTPWHTPGWHSLLRAV